MHTVSGVHGFHVTLAPFVIMCLSIEPRKKPKKRSGKKPQGKEAYFSVVVYMLNKGGRLAKE